MKLSKDLSLMQPTSVACIPRPLCCVTQQCGVWAWGRFQKRAQGLERACALFLGLVH